MLAGVEWYGLLLLFVFGLVFGSFANVVIWRFPRGESLAGPASSCPDCGETIRPYDNIPLVSWVLLRGRCRACGERISVRYPLVELSSAILWVMAGLSFGWSPKTAAAITLFYLLLILAFIDIDTMRLPNPIVLLLGSLGVLGAAVSAWSGAAIVPLTTVDAIPNPLVQAALGVMAGGGVSLVIALLYQGLRRRQGFGMGDVKLLAALGVYLGPYVLMTFFMGSLFGSVWGVVKMRREGAGATARFSFGPFLALAGVITALVGPELMFWYLSAVGLAS